MTSVLPSGPLLESLPPPVRTATMAGGETWTCIKSVSAYTGCNNLIMDPRDPKVLYAAFHQRQRKVFTYIGGGPESALFKSTDGGANWKKLEGGLPGGDIGRIGIDDFYRIQVGSGT